MDDLEAAANSARPAEGAADLIRRSIGGDVEVLGLGADQQVAYRAADDIGLVALQTGARGYLLKNSNVDYLVNAIRMVAMGGTAIQPEMAGSLAAGLRQMKKDEHEPEEKEHLTAREKEVLKLVAAGQSNKEIARELDIGESTVKFHIQSILRKLNLTSRVQAAVYATQGKGEV